MQASGDLALAKALAEQLPSLHYSHEDARSSDSLPSHV
jgi:hypothetical protein